MIPFENIDSRLEALGKNRSWLAEITGRSPGSIRAALAPNAIPKQRSGLLQKALSDAIEKEESAKSSDPLEHQLRQLKAEPALVLRPDADQFEAWEAAALASGKTLTKWALAALDELVAAGFEANEDSGKLQDTAQNQKKAKSA